jgi:sugar phosphate isomerase/epimerase
MTVRDTANRRRDSDDTMNHSPRRHFIKRTAAGVSALALSRPGLEAWAGSSTFSDKKTVPRMALQLWSVRQAIAEDLEGALRKVKSVGFHSVETAFFPDKVSLQQAGTALRKAGLKVSSMHCELPVGRQKDIWLAMAEAFSCKTMIWHGWPESALYKTVEGIGRLADRYNQAGAFAKSHGLRFGLHNHWWEMTPHPDGRLPLALLAEALDTDVFFEIDTYWAKVAGQNPARVVSQFADRTFCLHVKDGPGKTPDDSMVALGTGAQDFVAVAKAARNVEWMIVEFDKCDTDIFGALQQSVTYLAKAGLAESKY